MGKFIDLTGKRFGKWTVLKRVQNDKHRIPKFLCKCDCGTLKEVLSFTLRNGSSTNCGCYIYEKKQKLIGQRFGRWTIIKRVENNKYNQIRYLCQCDCGNIRVVYLGQLKSGRSKSCGCLSTELKRKRANIHSKSNTRIYHIFKSMKVRCLNPNYKAYKYYGARGIRVCDEWLDKENGFMNFYNWAMENGYRDDLTIDRIDNNGNYEPSNCRWVTMEIQANNIRTNIIIKYNNEEHTLSEWSKILKLNYKTIFKRYSDGFCLEDVFYDGDFRRKGERKRINEKSNT